MAIESKESLFARLTRLFKSGPIVRRKIAGKDTRLALPDGIYSSAASLFMKQNHPLYNIIGSSYAMAERMARYEDFNSMEQTSTIGAALSIYAAEIAAQDDRGRSLHIYSNNPKIKSILEDLFYNIINVEFNLRPWARTLCKYGDFLAVNDISPIYGVQNVVPIPVSEIERLEGQDKDDPLSVKFKWIRANKELENWEVSHMRLLGNDQYLPYGFSILDPVRKIWRQLILAEDAMLVYRLSRASDRRVFFFDVGNAPEDQIEAHMNRMKSNIRHGPVVDKNTGKVDLRYSALDIVEDYIIPVRGPDTGTKIENLAGGQNTAATEDVQYLLNKLISGLQIPKEYLGYEESLGGKGNLCLAPDTKIKLLDGRILTIKEITEEFQDGKENWVYSSKIDGSIVPGKIIAASPVKQVNELYKITFDGKESILCTENHQLLCRNGKYKKAKDLLINESIMPLYVKSSSKAEGDLLNGYEMIFDNKIGEWRYTHKMVNDVLFENNHKVSKQRVIHHKDCNKLNNTPSNLEEMTWYEHKKWHRERLETTLFRPDVIEKKELARLSSLTTEEYKSKRRAQMAEQSNPGTLMYQWRHSKKLKEDTSNRMKEIWKRPEYRESKLEQNKIKLNSPEAIAKRVCQRAKKYDQYTLEYIKTYCLENFCFKINDVSKGINVSKHIIRKIIKKNGFNKWRIFIKQIFDIGWLEKYCKENKIYNISNFCKGGSKIKSCVIDYILKSNNINWSGFLKRINSNHRITSIEIIKYDKSMWVYDITVDQWHNFAINIGENTGNIISSNSQLDVRFSRTINSIQKIMISELNKIAIIHLFANGYDGEDLLDFSIKLSNPSTIAQQQKLELYRAKFEIAASVPENLLSKRYLRQEVIGLTNEEIDQIEKELIEDKKMDSKLESIATGGSVGSGGETAPGVGGDLFGGGAGGGEAGGEEKATEAGEEAPTGGEENLPPDNVELLTSAEEINPEQHIDIQVSDKDRKSPIKPMSQIQRFKHNRQRRRHHGPEATGIPSTKDTANNKYMNDPYDKETLNRVAKGTIGDEKLVDFGELLRESKNINDNSYEKSSVGLPSYFARTLIKMEESIKNKHNGQGFYARTKLIVEEDEQEYQEQGSEEININVGLLTEGIYAEKEEELDEPNAESEGETNKDGTTQQ